MSGSFVDTVDGNESSMGRVGTFLLNLSRTGPSARWWVDLLAWFGVQIWSEWVGGLVGDGGCLGAAGRVGGVCVRCVSK